MPVPANMGFFIDATRCIGCEACVQACTECDTHKGHSMIHLEYLDRTHSVQTAPVVCMHCESPTCAEVCPADAIKRTEDGVVQTARKPRCIACNNCVLACPFGVPKMTTEFMLMMKCDMCYDRTSAGKRRTSGRTKRTRCRKTLTALLLLLHSARIPSRKISPMDYSDSPSWNV